MLEEAYHDIKSKPQILKSYFVSETNFEKSR